MRFVIFGGAALISTFVFGCSPPPDPIAKASASFKVDYPVTPGLKGTCNAVATAGIGSDAGVPELPVAGQTSPRISEFGGEIVDGQTGSNGKGRYDVECKITGEETMQLEITMSGPNTHPLVDATSAGVARLQLTGTIKADGTGDGFVSVLTTKTGNVSPEVPCIFAAVAEPADASKFQVAPGEARLTFTCPHAKSALDDFSVCETRGTISIRDCFEQ